MNDAIQQPNTLGNPHYEETGDAPGAFDALRLLQAVLTKWVTVLLVLLFAVCAAAFYLSKATPLYKARAVIELSARRPRILSQQAAVIEDPSLGAQFEQTLNTQFEKLKSNSLLRDALACYRRKNAADGSTDDELAKRMRTGLSFELLRRTRLVEIVVASSDPVFAARACAALAEGAEANARAENSAASTAAVAWLEAQVKTQQQELEAADQRVLASRQDYKLDALEGQRATGKETLLSLNEALVDTESQAAKESELLDALSSMELTPETAGELPTAIPRAADVESALERWLAAKAEREALLSKYTTAHPEVVAHDQTVALYHGQALAALMRAETTTASNLALLQSQAESLRRMKDAQSTAGSDLERDILDREMKVAALERARMAADTSYRGVLARIQEARLSADENTATVKLVEAASLPDRPFSPRPLHTLLLAVLLGLVGGVGLALATDALEDHVASLQDVETGVGLKVLAVIPHVKHGSREAVATASLARRFGELTEAFASLHSLLNSAAYRGESKVILVSSSLPEEGKTVTCCNLAVACARSGQRTLLVDFDLRRPRIADVFPMPPGQQGLLGHLAAQGDRKSVETLVYATDCANLSVIATRPVQGASPAELVGGKLVADLVDWASATFDRVILDAPPLGLVSDALVLSGMATAVLIVARPKTSRKRAVRHTAQRLLDVGANVVGAVLNDVDFSKWSYHGYGPYYHYRKHYRAYHEPQRAAPIRAVLRMDGPPEGTA